MAVVVVVVSQCVGREIGRRESERLKVKMFARS